MRGLRGFHAGRPRCQSDTHGWPEKRTGLIWSGIFITLPNERGCQGDGEAGIMDERRHGSSAGFGERLSFCCAV